MPTKISISKKPHRYTRTFRRKLGEYAFQLRLGLTDQDPRFVSKLLQLLHVVVGEIDRRIERRPGWQDRYTEIRVFNLLAVLLLKQFVEKYKAGGAKWTQDASQVSRFLSVALDVLEDAEREFAKQFEPINVKTDVARHFWYRLFDYSKAEAEADARTLADFFAEGQTAA